MEKANEVYNKLKLQFVGKNEPAAKSQLEDQNQDNGGPETQLQGIEFLDQWVACLMITYIPNLRHALQVFTSFSLQTDTYFQDGTYFYICHKISHTVI